MTRHCTAAPIVGRMGQTWANKEERKERRKERTNEKKEQKEKKRKENKRKDKTITKKKRKGKEKKRKKGRKKEKIMKDTKEGRNQGKDKVFVGRVNLKTLKADRTAVVIGIPKRSRCGRRQSVDCGNARTKVQKTWLSGSRMGSGGKAQLNMVVVDKILIILVPLFSGNYRIYLYIN